MGSAGGIGAVFIGDEDASSRARLKGPRQASRHRLISLLRNAFLVLGFDRKNLGIGPGGFSRKARAVAAIGCLAMGATAQTGHAAVVSACTGVSLPPSVVTDIVGDVLVPTIGPIETALETLDVLNVLNLNLNLTGTLNSVAAGDPISLSVLDVDGNVVDVLSDPVCDTAADSFQMSTQKGISVGGNSITGLGTTGLEADAGELNAIAIGDNASTAVGADAAIAIGENASSTHSGSVALGANSVADGTTLSDAAYLVGGTALAEVNIGDRRITGLAAGANPTDAVNVAQLQALSDLAVQYDDSSQTVVTLGGVGGTTITNVADGLIASGSTDAVNGGQLYDVQQQVDQNTSDITNINTQITNLTNGTAGLVQQTGGSPGSGDITVGAATGGNTVDFAGTDGDRTLTGVADGAVTDTSTDAVNGSQLYAVQQQVDQNTSDITNLDTRVTNVEGDVTDLDTRVTNIEGDITSINTQITNLLGGSLGLVQQTGGSPGSGEITVGAATGGATVNIAGTDGDRTLTGVADGAVSDTSTDAVNGSQLYAVQQQVDQNTTNITSLQNSTDGYFQVNNTAANPKPIVSGANSLGAGAGAVASGGDSVAVGMGAVASGNNSVALGNNSVADIDDTVSVGAVGFERQITNVAAGVRDTDAVNLGQLNASMDQVLNLAQDYTDARISQLGFNLSSLRKDSEAATASAMALNGIPQTMDAGGGMVGMGVATWQGESAFALGLSKASDNGRIVVKAGATMNTRGKGGANAGIGFGF